MRWCLLVLVAAAISSGCKKRPSYDLSTPESTVAAFFAALDKGRIPEDLDTFVADPQEQSLWRFRCKQRGCSGGDFDVLEVAEMSGYHATLVVDYTVFGERDNVVMRGQRSPLKLERQGDQWLLVQFGKRVSASKRGAVFDAGAATPSGDQDAGADAGE